MFDNLRDLADDAFYEEDQKQDTLFEEAGETEKPVAKPAPKKRRQGKFLGMTAPQRFVLSVMLMFTVLLLGMLAMFVFGKMSIAF
ncbi:MAG: hypothetical protein AB1509_03950 [Chloroflexota bacterium]